MPNNPTTANLWTGYNRSEEHRGSLAGSVVTINLDRPCVSVAVKNKGSTTPIYFTTDGTAPTSDGTGPDATKMAEVEAGETVTLDIATNVVKVHGANGIAYRVTAVY